MKIDRRTDTEGNGKKLVNHHIERDDNFKYLGSVTTYVNVIKADIGNRIRTGNAYN